LFAEVLSSLKNDIINSLNANYIYLGMLMNSENLPNSELGNSNFEPMKLSDEPQVDELPTEVTSDAIDDILPEEKSGEITLDQTDTMLDEPDLISEVDELELSEVEFATSTPVETASEDSQNYSNGLSTNSSDNSSDESELFVDSWLDELQTEQSLTNTPQSVSLDTSNEIEQLEQQKADLQQEIVELKAQTEQMRSQQMAVIQDSLTNMIEEGTQELKERKTALRTEIDKLERRKERINQEMRSNFAGSSKELAIRVQGFKEYLVGSLQDLASAANKLELTKVEDPTPRSRERRPENSGSRERVKGRETTRDRDRGRRREPDRGRSRNSSSQPTNAQFSEPTFADQSRRIRQLLDQYRNSPDYYGSPWQLRRTFEQNQAKKVQDWFFGQGGRGAIDSTGSRLQNILLASAAISVLHSLYGDRCRILVLTDTPENLGEWRRGLQDCLGISRSNFGANRGVTLFDSPDVLVQRAERLIDDKLLPLIFIDETEDLLNLSVLKFPLWMAFASTNKTTPSNYLY